MPETTILNPTTVWDEEIQDCMTPDYGWQRDRPTTRAVAKPAGGFPWSRETSNAGHTFTFSWLNRSELCARRVKQFFEQYEDGFFTIVDWDYGTPTSVDRPSGNERHYVGRFTAAPQIVQTGNDRYQIQSVPFEEMPGAPMLKYPSDWDNDSVMLKAINDFGDLMPAISGAWAQQVVSNVDDGTSNQVLTNPGNPFDSVTYEYRGYGFRLSMGMGPAMGQAQVYVDGVPGPVLDLYAPQDQGLQVAFEQGALPLQIHRVQVQVLDSANPASTGNAITWGYMEAMR